MTDYAKLRVSELKVLKREEETVQRILSKYRNSLNALKVEELTLFKLMGTTQDRERQSRNPTPLNEVLPGSRPPSRSRAQSTDSTTSSGGGAEGTIQSVNRSSLNLTAAPLIRRMLEDQSAYEEDEQD